MLLGEHNGSVLDYVGAGDGISEEALPKELTRSSARFLEDHWPGARLSVAFKDDERLDAVADVDTRRVAIYRFEKPLHGHGWRLAATSTCSS